MLFQQIFRFTFHNCYHFHLLPNKYKSQFKWTVMTNHNGLFVSIDDLNEIESQVVCIIILPFGKLLMFFCFYLFLIFALGALEWHKYMRYRNTIQYQLPPRIAYHIHIHNYNVLVSKVMKEQSKSIWVSMGNIIIPFATSLFYHRMMMLIQLQCNNKKPCSIFHSISMNNLNWFLNLPYVGMKCFR